MPKTIESPIKPTKQLSAPPRAAFGDINTNILKEASAYVDTVKGAMRSDTATADDLCEAERYLFEVSAAYSLQTDDSVLRSMIDSTVVEKIKPELEALKQDLVKNIEGRFNELQAWLFNDRMQKKNDVGYAKYLQNTKTYGNLPVYPLMKEKAGLMNSALLVSLKFNTTLLSPLKAEPLVGETYGAAPKTWNEVFTLSHNQVRDMCHWYNDDLGISDDLNQTSRQFAIAAWLAGRTFYSDPEPEVNAAAATVRRSLPDGS